MPAGMVAPGLRERATTCIMNMARNVNATSSAIVDIQNMFSNDIAAGTLDNRVQDLISQMIQNRQQLQDILARGQAIASQELNDARLADILNLDSNSLQINGRTTELAGRAMRYNQNAMNDMMNAPPLALGARRKGSKSNKSRKSRKSSKSKGKRSNRPKSKKMCAKRHMKWNASTKRCNKNK